MAFRKPRSLVCRTGALAAALIAGAPGCTEDAGEGTLDVLRYELDGAFDWETQRLDATVRITFTGPAGGERVEFDSAVDLVKEVRGPDGATLPFEVDSAARRLKIDLPERAAGPVTIAVAYEAAASESLRAIPPRKGDPVQIRALFTHSEPLGASTWMPCNDRPDDRAEMAITMAMEADEAMISNGALVRDEAGGGGRTMGYEMKSPIPTYQTAFAISRFEVEASNEGSVPVEVWHRAGVRGSYGPLLAELNREMALFEGLLGPYPFEKYRLVLLPEIPGMENASITFQNETQSAEPEIIGDLALTAHELGHQWCGDLVTVATWNDLWIKEGMATLLEAEAMRAFEEQGGKGALLGDWFYPEDGVPVRDFLRAPDDKYTSGAYSRGAWVFTQIRAVVGEEVFWSTWRGLLEAHRFGSVGADDVIEAFAPHLGPDATERTRRAVDLGSLPMLDAQVEEDGDFDGDLTVTLFMDDRDGVLIAPFDFEWRRANGQIERLTMGEGGSLVLDQKDPADLLVVDPLDIHPPLDLFPGPEDPYPWDDVVYLHPVASLARLRSGTPESIPQYDDLGGRNQLEAIYWWDGPLVSLEAYPEFVASLDAETAKALALQYACYFGSDSETPEAWGSMVAAELAEDPHTLGLGWTFRWCAGVPEVDALFAPEWAAVTPESLPPEMSLGRLQYLAGMTSPPGSAYDLWSSMVNNADALRARGVAASRIRANAIGTVWDPEIGAAYRALVLELLETNETSEVLREAIRASRVYADPGTDNADLLAALAKILHSPIPMSVHWRAVCAAHHLTRDDPATWKAFVAGLDGAPLSHDASRFLALPLDCP